MAYAIEWDKVGEKTYEIGVDHGVLYLQDGTSYANGVPWNGLITVTESPSGAEATKLYADNIPYINLRSVEEFGATIECYTYPDEFAECNGEAEPVAGIKIGQQTRKNFGLSYRTKLGNDSENTDYGYKLHIIYGCSASPSERAYGTENDSPDAITFSYEVTTTPVNVTGYSATSSIVIDSTKTDPSVMAQIESILYGDSSSSTQPRLPMPDEILALAPSGAML